MVFPTFFNLSLNLAIGVHDLSHSPLPVLFFWLYRASPSLAAKNIINLILVLAIWWCPSVKSSLVLLEEGVFTMTSAFSWQNSISLFPASFCTARPNLPVTPGVSWLPTLASIVSARGISSWGSQAPEPGSVVLVYGLSCPAVCGKGDTRVQSQKWKNDLGSFPMKIQNQSN